MGNGVPMVDVAGIPVKLPQKLSIPFDRVDFRNIPDAVAHNEDSVRLVCEEEESLISSNDRFDLTLEQTSTGYTVSAKTNSEARSGLWANGSMTLTYNNATGKWSMGAVHLDREWKFCSPEKALQIFVDGLLCVSANIDNQDVAAALMTIGRNISIGSADIAKSATLYADASDCQPPVEQSDPYEGLVGSGLGG